MAANNGSDSSMYGNEWFPLSYPIALGTEDISLIVGSPQKRDVSERTSAENQDETNLSSGDSALKTSLDTLKTHGKIVRDYDNFEWSPLSYCVKLNPEDLLSICASKSGTLDRDDDDEDDEDDDEIHPMVKRSDFASKVVRLDSEPNDDDMVLEDLENSDISESRIQRHLSSLSLSAFNKVVLLNPEQLSLLAKQVEDESQDSDVDVDEDVDNSTFKLSARPKEATSQKPSVPFNSKTFKVSRGNSLDQLANAQESKSQDQSTHTSPGKSTKISRVQSSPDQHSPVSVSEEAAYLKAPATPSLPLAPKLKRGNKKHENDVGQTTVEAKKSPTEQKLSKPIDKVDSSATPSIPTASMLSCDEGPDVKKNDGVESTAEPNSAKPIGDTSLSKPANENDLSKPAEPNSPAKPAEPNSPAKPAEPYSPAKPAVQDNAISVTTPGDFNTLSKPAVPNSPAKTTVENLVKPFGVLNTIASPSQEPTSVARSLEPTTAKPAVEDNAISVSIPGDLAKLATPSREPTSVARALDYASFDAPSFELASSDSNGDDEARSRLDDVMDEVEEEPACWEVDVSDLKVVKAKVKAKKSAAPKKGVVKPVHEFPPNTATVELMSTRKVLNLKRWYCISRPQYKASCGLSSVVSVWNYLFSTLGDGHMPPITQEQALSILGFAPPFGEIRFGPFTGNKTLMRWFTELNTHYKVAGRTYMLYKPKGRAQTLGVTSEQALRKIKSGLKSDNAAYIYHCYNHYFCPMGFEDTPLLAENAYRTGLKSDEYETWIIIGEPSRKQPVFHAKRWEDISEDLNNECPDYTDMRRLWRGKQKLKTKKVGGNLHCIMAFERSHQQPRVVKKEVKK